MRNSFGDREFHCAFGRAFLIPCFSKFEYATEKRRGAFFSPCKTNAFNSLKNMNEKGNRVPLVKVPGSRYDGKITI